VIFPAAILAVAILAEDVGADLASFDDPLIRDFFATAMVIPPGYGLNLRALPYVASCVPNSASRFRAEMTRFPQKFRSSAVQPVKNSLPMG
jgi:hypothetical protein